MLHIRLGRIKKILYVSQIRREIQFHYRHGWKRSEPKHRKQKFLLTKKGFDQRTCEFIPGQLEWFQCAMLYLQLFNDVWNDLGCSEA